MVDNFYEQFYCYILPDSWIYQIKLLLTVMASKTTTDSRCEELIDAALIIICAARICGSQILIFDQDEHSQSLL